MTLCRCPFSNPFLLLEKDLNFLPNIHETFSQQYQLDMNERAWLELLHYVMFYSNCKIFTYCSFKISYYIWSSQISLNSIVYIYNTKTIYTNSFLFYRIDSIDSDCSLKRKRLENLRIYTTPISNNSGHQPMFHLELTCA